MQKQKKGPCSIIESFDMIGSKWKLIILNDLQNGEKRFNELKRSTEASSRTLSRVLENLREEGLVEKRVEDGNPVASYYSLTEAGKSLCPVFEEIEAWAEEWLD
ncbi:winged helix-turn-helix transcriptional regulator [Candidatus Nanohalovita haloferacivicina]|uniref:winged helix-turn-helix transcriptional regulator n=1 Tax=Candidatus Nanohalovita haloferacivicina TaxID=2978046 RepID=UPI00325FD486|nr:DNA-binding transcriptional regulator, HxlR family [Candidatus Nanohalobia archaeon BNXNv]